MRVAFFMVASAIACSGCIGNDFSVDPGVDSGEPDRRAGSVHTSRRTDAGTDANTPDVDKPDASPDTMSDAPSEAFRITGWTCTSSVLDSGDGKTCTCVRSPSGTDTPESCGSQNFYTCCYIPTEAGTSPDICGCTTVYAGTPCGIPMGIVLQSCPPAS